MGLCVENPSNPDDDIKMKASLEKIEARQEKITHNGNTRLLGYTFVF